MVNVIPYCSAQHEGYLREWLPFYGMDDSTLSMTPEMGFIAEEDGIFFAVGFLRKVEKCEFGFLDNLIANPKTSGKLRYRAIDELVFKIFENAKKVGIKKLVAYTLDSAVLKRAERLGFIRMPPSVIGKDLGD